MHGHLCCGRTRGVLRAAVCLAILTMLDGCTVQGAPSGGSGSSPPSVGTLVIVLRLPDSLYAVPVSPRVIPEATRFVRATVTGQGISSPITQDISLGSGGGGTATLAMDVPSGPDRSLKVEAFTESLVRLAQAMSSVDIREGVNQPVSLRLEPEAWILPTVTASATPTSPATGSLVSFSGTASDADGTIVLYEWDFDGNGSWDYASAISPDTTYRYYSAKAYTATLGATDNDGLVGKASVLITVQ